MAISSTVPSIYTPSVFFSAFVSANTRAGTTLPSSSFTVPSRLPVSVFVTPSPSVIAVATLYSVATVNETFTSSTEIVIVISPDFAAAAVIVLFESSATCSLPSLSV